MIVLVQGTGVAESAPNPDGSPSNANRDFIAQGIGNLASGLFRGQPVGGSVGQTALNVAAGGRSRWASIFSGLWMLLILVLFSGVVGEIPIPTLAAVLIFAAASSLRLGRIDTVIRTGLPSQVAFFATLAATLFLPVTAAVGIGVGLSLLLQVNQEAVDLTVVRLTHGENRSLVESPAPATLPSREVTVLDVYGSLLFAGARTLQTRLPDPAGSEQPVVVLRLRGRTTLGATAFIVLADYAEQLHSDGGHLFLSGVGPDLLEQLRHTHRVDLRDAVTVIPASETILESTQKAYDDAEEWLAVARFQPWPVAHWMTCNAPEPRALAASAGQLATALPGTRHPGRRDQEIQRRWRRQARCADRVLGILLGLCAATGVRIDSRVRVPKQSRPSAPAPGLDA